MKMLSTIASATLLLLSTAAFAEDPTQAQAPAPAGDPAAAPATTPESTVATTSSESAVKDGIRLGLNVFGALPMGAISGAGTGFGIGVRGGYEMRWNEFGLTPELLIEYVSIGGGSVIGAKGGARAGYDFGSITPFLAAHFGLDKTTNESVLGFDIGGGADYAINSNFKVGLLVAYNLAFTTGSSAGWVSFGAGAGYAF